ncbi:MAG: hypothetical protein WD039_09640, partial [Xanthobacteraceae bacterium]
MTRFLRDFRLVPVVLFAAGSLFVLKVVGIVNDGGYTLAESPDAIASSLDGSAAALTKLPASVEKPQSWAQEMLNFPNTNASVRETEPAVKFTQIPVRSGIALDVTGSVGASKPAEKPDGAPGNKSATDHAANPPKDPGGMVVSLDPDRSSSPAERAILGRLQERRQEIEAQGRELEIREGLVKAAEKRLEARLAELKELEARVSTAAQDREGSDARRFKALVTMYENMKPKDAAKIFDRLDLAVLVQVTSQINPRQMSEILANMSPEAGERLTVDLAN